AVAGMSKPGSDYIIAGGSINQGRTERRVGVCPADENREPDAVAAALHASGKESQQTRWRGSRPDEPSANAGAKDRHCGKRKCRLVKDVALDRAARQLSPLRGNGRKLRAGTPFDAERGLDGTMHEISAPRGAR